MSGESEAKRTVSKAGAWGFAELQGETVCRDRDTLALFVYRQRQKLTA